jgi:hypothetical protein
MAQRDKSGTAFEAEKPRRVIGFEKWRRGRDSNPRAANLDRAEFVRSFPSENPYFMALYCFDESSGNRAATHESEGNNAIMAA